MVNGRGSPSLALFFLIYVFICVSQGPWDKPCPLWPLSEDSRLVYTQVLFPACNTHPSCLHRREGCVLTARGVNSHFPRALPAHTPRATAVGPAGDRGVRGDPSSPCVGSTLHTVPHHLNTIPPGASARGVCSKVPPVPGVPRHPGRLHKTVGILKREGVLVGFFEPHLKLCKDFRKLRGGRTFSRERPTPRLEGRPLAHPVPGTPEGGQGHLEEPHRTAGGTGLRTGSHTRHPAPKAHLDTCHDLGGSQDALSPSGSAKPL